MNKASAVSDPNSFETSNCSPETTDSSEVEETAVRVKARGSTTGFSKRQKFSIARSVNTSTSENPTAYSKSYFPSNKIQFGFMPLPFENKPSAIYFDANIDTLQAPSDKKHHRKNDKRSPHFTKVPTSIKTPVKRQDNKSNLDFLGIFDTRKYFFISRNRRNHKKVLSI